MAARIENERVRAGLIGERYLGAQRPAADREDGVVIITAGWETESTIRLILAKADSGAADPRPNLDLPRNDSPTR
ncbi:hypothetical protein R1X32_08305 (plasmid) [Rhodococcus opacus]|uniref:Uncharacterized protein n=2 Tax=Rhodococcus TaxID=1827 RepID=K8XYM6_RHOOP|nr:MULTISPECIES: hypothetical protein [Rhodococcus]EKT83417.1 hypothetical protein WSS_A07144 [Rhodococcus opacus M213]ELB87633.1 hypothetical protein Rwratislav_38823 [Rhodococcus wratislaviensis IFP 2016]QSE87391.1 hypothetical protein JWS13_01740 [Rhodococcus pseudokoreensis]WKN60010.1 hypothetical protein HJ581_0039965 [Rhodococcus opacus]